MQSKFPLPWFNRQAIDGKQPAHSKLWINLNKINGLLLLALVLAGVVQYRWISFSIFQYSDWRFQFSEAGAAFMELSPWTTNSSLGQGSYSLWKLPFNFIYGAFQSLGFNSNVSEKFFVFWPAIFLPPLASFLLVKKVVRSNPAALAGSLVYSLNSYFFSINSAGHVFLTVASAWGVMTICFFITALTKRQTKYYVITALLGCLAVTYDLRMALIASFVVAAYWSNLIITNNNKILIIKGTIGGVGIIVGIFTLLNIYWLLPELSSNLMLGSGIMQRSLFGNEFQNIMYAIGLFHPFWTGGKPEWFLSQPIPLYFFIVPLLAFSGLVLNRRNKDVIFFGLISLVGIFLAKQSGEPFTQFYLFLFTNLPGFGAFREASKFYFLIAISYAVLTGAMVSWLHKNQSSYTFVPFLKYLVWIIILSLSTWNAKPLIMGEIETLFVKRHVPDDYVHLHQYILTDKAFSRVLWIPTEAPWEVNTDKHPAIGISSLISNEWKEHTSTQSTANNINALLGEDYFHNLISSASVRYIVVPLKDVANDGDFYQYYGGSRMFFIKQLDKLSFLKKLNIGMSDVILYENTEFRPHLYLTKTIDSLSNATSFRSVDFVEKRRTEFNFSISNLLTPVYLQFTDAYQPNWHLNYGSFRWWDVFGENPTAKLNLTHMKTDSGLNVFKIDPLYIKHNFPKTAYKENLDGSIDVDITLYYRPQAYLNLGLLISFLSLIGCAAYLLIDGIRRHKKHTNESRIVQQF